MNPVRQTEHFMAAAAMHILRARNLLGLGCGAVITV